MKIIIMNPSTNDNIINNSNIQANGFNVIAVHSIEELEEHLGHKEPAIVIVGDNDSYDPYNLGQILHKEYPYVSCILKMDDTKVNFRLAMNSGFLNTINNNMNDNEVINILMKISFQQTRFFNNLDVDSEEESEDDKEGTIISIASPKGGVGKTTLAVNLAMAFSKLDKKVAIVDLDLQFGDVPILMDLKPKYTIYEWVKDVYGTNRDEIKKYMISYDEHVDVLSAPLMPEQSDEINGQHINALINILTKKYDIIIIDTPPALYDSNLMAYERSDQILFITTPNITSIKNVKIGMVALEKLGWGQKINIIINRATEMKDLSLKTVRSVLNKNIVAMISSDYEKMIDCINMGTPYMKLYNNKAIVKEIDNLAEFFIGEKVVGKKSIFKPFKKIGQR